MLKNNQTSPTPNFDTIVTPSQTVTGGSANGPANSVNQVAPAVPGAIFTNGYLMSSTERMAHGNVPLFYDQWLNAPPSQPPKQPSFFAAI